MRIMSYCRQESLVFTVFFSEFANYSKENWREIKKCSVIRVNYEWPLPNRSMKNYCIIAKLENHFFYKHEHENWKKNLLRKTTIIKLIQQKDNNERTKKSGNTNVWMGENVVS